MRLNFKTTKGLYWSKLSKYAPLWPCKEPWHNVNQYTGLNDHGHFSDFCVSWKIQNKFG